MKPKVNPTESDARAALIAGWLAKFNDTFSTYGKPLEDRPGVFDAFDDGLSDIPAGELAAAFAEWNRTGKHFPSPGDIRGLITQKREAEQQYAAEEAWYELRWRLMFFNWDPENGYLPLFVGKECHLTDRVAAATTKTEYNGGFLLKPKPLPARTQHAIEAVGGLKRIAELPAGSGFDFCKRAFLEAHRSPIVERLQLGKGEAKALLAQIQEAQ